MQSVRPKTKPEKEPIKQYSGQYKTANDYAEALRSWMLQLYQMQCIHSSFPFFLANLQAQASQATSANPISTLPVSSSMPPSSHPITSTQPTHPLPTPPEQQAQQRQPEAPRRGIELTIPPIQKRFFAEMIDFIPLFIFKLVLTYIAVDTFDLLEDVNKYDLETLSTDLLTDYKAALSITSDILFLELLHRIGTCIFESMCLHSGGDGLGGATPGKRLMRLRVVRWELTTPIMGNRIIVYPSSDLGFGRAVVRSLLKNFSLTLFPICFTMFSFQHNRAIYDIFAGSIVVEEPARTLNNNNLNNNNNARA